MHSFTSRGTAFLQIGQRRAPSSLTLSRLSNASSSWRVVPEKFVSSLVFRHFFGRNRGVTIAQFATIHLLNHTAPPTLKATPRVTAFRVPKVDVIDLIAKFKRDGIPVLPTKPDRTLRCLVQDSERDRPSLGHNSIARWRTDVSAPIYRQNAWTLYAALRALRLT